MTAFNGNQILHPAVAGKFYPADANELRREVRFFIQQAACEPTTQAVTAALVPHAGYVFSGPVAGYTFKHISLQKPDVILFAALSHQGVRGGCVFPGQALRTPLGDVLSDPEVTSALLDWGDPFYADIHPYYGEHSIEVNLPFMQEVFPHAKAACVLISQTHPQTCRRIGEAIADTIRRFRNQRILILVSSDMSHFPQYTDANRVDHAALEVLEKVQPEHYLDFLQRFETAGIANLRCVMCGSAATLSVLEAAKALGVQEGKVLHYRNSGDSEYGDHDRVVGYGAMAWYAPPNPTGGLQTEDQKELLSIARKSIEARLLNQTYTPVCKNPALLEQRGVFVTIRNQDQLRGCLGRFDATGYPLYELTAELAVETAVSDSRFSPVSVDELSEITISLSVLSPERRVHDVKEIQVGVHGVKIVQGKYNGTLLPQVAIERGWNAIEFLEHTCVKANLPRDAWKAPETEIYVYEAKVFSEEDEAL